MSDITKLTEIVTGLGMLGDDHPTLTLPARPGELRNVDDTTWDAVVTAWNRPETRPLVDAAFHNGRYFHHAADGLRGRRPRLVEWTGPQRSPGDEVAPVDLRVDHVYLVSCKYLSKITMNASPSHLFERMLTGGHGRRGTDWYQQVAPIEYERLWRASSEWIAAHDTAESPPPMVDPASRSRDARREMSAQLRVKGGGWPPELRPVYESLCGVVSERSAEVWNAALRDGGARAAEAMLWRLLRIGSAPYFVLGTGTTSGGSTADALRLRVASPWDWRQHFGFKSLCISPMEGGQPMVRWEATFAHLQRVGQPTGTVNGHVEVRWSHGRFGGPPEAKVYLDTPFDQVPGYWAVS